MLQDSTSQIVLLSEVNDEKFNALFCYNEFNALITLQGRHIVGLVTVEQYIVNNWNQQNLHNAHTTLKQWSDVTVRCHRNAVCDDARVSVESFAATAKMSFVPLNILKELQEPRTYLGLTHSLPTTLVRPVVRQISLNTRLVALRYHRQHGVLTCCKGDCQSQWKTPFLAPYSSKTP